MKKSIDAFFSFLKGSEGRFKFAGAEMKNLSQEIDRISNQMDLLQTRLRREAIDSERMRNILKKGTELIDSLRFFVTQKGKGRKTHACLCDGKPKINRIE